MCVFKKLYILVIFSVCSGCTKIEFSPNQKFDGDSPVAINRDNLSHLLKTEDDDTLRFVLSGDSQRSYDNVTDFVATVNRMQGIDFVILDGDISDFGLLQEMKWIDALYSGLKVPYIGVIGNHDLQANGNDVFRRMYGELNYSFVYDSIKFVCHDTNSREYNFNGTAPDLKWLRNEFRTENGIKGFVAVGHVPPFATDFDPGLETEYLHILSSVNLLGSLYAHINKTGVFYYTNDGDRTFYTHADGSAYENESPPFIVTNAIANREFLIVEIVNGKLSSKSIKY